MSKHTSTDLRLELQAMRDMASPKTLESMYQRLLVVVITSLVILSFLLFIISFFLNFGVQISDFIHLDIDIERLYKIGELLSELGKELLGSTAIFFAFSFTTRSTRSANRETIIYLIYATMLFLGVIFIMLYFNDNRIIIPIRTYSVDRPTIEYEIGYFLSTIFLGLGTQFIGALVIFFAVEQLLKMLDAQNEIQQQLLDKIDQLAQKFDE